MSKGSGLTRGDVRRNERKAGLRVLVPASHAVAGVDLGERKQAVAVTGDDRVLARRTLRVSVHGLGETLDWAAGVAGGGVCGGDGGVRADGVAVDGGAPSCAGCGGCRWCACSRWSVTLRGSSRT